MATLFIASGPHDGRWFPLGKKTLVVGRDEGLLAQVVDDSVSRRHLSIRYDHDTGRYFALDMNSKNGVFINELQVAGEAPLRDNDLVRIGETLLLFTESDFTGDDNALSYYRQRGQRAKETLRLKGEDARSAIEQLNDRAAGEPAD